MAARKAKKIPTDADVARVNAALGIDPTVVAALPVSPSAGQPDGALRAEAQSLLADAHALREEAAGDPNLDAEAKSKILARCAALLAQAQKVELGAEVDTRKILASSAWRRLEKRLVGALQCEKCATAVARALEDE